jgi:4-amino-4-deoxy-L-arabinose transferase-like glycosyltransferase
MQHTASAQRIPQISPAVTSSPPCADARATIGWREALILLVFAILVNGYSILDGRDLTIHEAVHCLNTREMLANHDWVIPSYGGKPWLERPPLPFYITGAVVELSGGQTDEVWPYRVSPMIMGFGITLMLAWLASLWYGRANGLVSGLVLQTMREFNTYVTGTEADIFLCFFVTAALALFVRLEFAGLRAPSESLRFFGRRGPGMLGFFVVMGLTNLNKGLIFGTVFVVVPMVSFLLWNGGFQALRRYCWFWGWAAYLGTSLVWPVLAYRRYPDIVDLWLSDYAGRVGTDYMHEPFWYYFANLPWNIFPWTLVALIGLWLVYPRGEAGPEARRRFAVARFLYCWAILPILLFSCLRGKHHHYLLQCTAPWAILAAVGSSWLWQRFSNVASRSRIPLATVLLSIGVVDFFLLAFGSRLPGPAWLSTALMIAWPLCALGFYWTLSQRNAVVVTACAFGLILVLHWLSYSYRTLYLNSYEQDLVFLRQAKEAVPGQRTILVPENAGPLGASWFLFYLADRGAYLHNLTFLLDERIRDPEVYVIARASDEAALKSYGVTERLLQSQRTRAERSVEDRFTLFLLHFRDGLPRVSANVRISPMQATGRAPGPFLTPTTSQVAARSPE